MIPLLMGCSPDYGVNHDVIEYVDGEIVVETWTAVEPALDIMVIVDQSCSMNDERKWLTDSMITVAKHLDARRDVDWRIATRSADPHEDANEWIDETSSNLALDIFVSLFSGSAGYESGLDAMVSSMVNDDHRPDADTLFWILSDEPDQSIHVTDESVEQTHQWFKAPPFGHSVMSSVYRDSEEAGSCSSYGGVGTGYLEHSDYITTLCHSADWSDTVDLVIEDASDINKYHYLAQEPALFSTVYVFWDGVQLQGNYTISGRLVEFERPPEPGIIITVAYMVRL